jgi:DNA repair protein RecO
VRLDRVDPQETPLAATIGREPGEAARVLGHSSYFAELIDEWAPDGSPNERLFRLGAAVGTAMGRGGSVDALARYFEYWLLRLEGVYPAIDRCPRCGQGLGDEAVLVAAERSYVCASCAQAGPRLSRQALTFLRGIGARTPADVTDAGAPASALRDLEDVHHRLIALHLEKSLRSARVVKELGQHS